jgi:tRNA threonylcarbamoyladenosine biosynthesis protein TsaE
LELFLADEHATLRLGKQLAQLFPSSQFTIFLEGDLGAGKTTLTRGLLQALGHKGKVKSPTYTLVEHYELNSRAVNHFDLYRVSDPEELEYLGLDDYFRTDAICLVEWAKQGSEHLPNPDLIINISYDHHARIADITATSISGQHVYDKLNN